MKYEDFVDLQDSIANKMWRKAQDAMCVAVNQGINLGWYSIWMSPKSIHQKYSYGYWLQLYLYYDLLDQGYRKGNLKFINKLDKAYYIGDWKSL